jgi:hypothetical protein
MKKIILWMALSLLAGGSANAALQGRLPATVGGTDYQAYYDTELNITWLADANYAKTSFYDSDGVMTWLQAQDWITSLNTKVSTGVVSLVIWSLGLVPVSSASEYDKPMGGVVSITYVGARPSSSKR